MKTKHPEFDLCDLSDVKLRYRAGAFMAGLQGRIPGRQELNDIVEQYGVGVATAVWVRAVQESPLHGGFGRELMGLDLSHEFAASKKIAAQYEVTVVASTSALGFREWGAHVDEWRGWAREIGFTTEVIATNSRNNVDENARFISEFLNNNPHHKRIIVTYGQGATELRQLLERRLRDTSAGLPTQDLKGVAAWISVCGSFAGATSSSLALKNWFSKILARLKLSLKGQNPKALSETSSESWIWKGEVPLPRDVFVASVIAAPVLPQILRQNWRQNLAQNLKAKSMLRQYLKIAKQDPNDGVLTLTECIVNPSVIVPVPGMNHNADAMKLKPVLQRLLALTVRTLESRAESDLFVEYVSKNQRRNDRRIRFNDESGSVDC
jgi:hypothetical protein